MSRNAFHILLLSLTLTLLAPACKSEKKAIESSASRFDAQPAATSTDDKTAASSSDDKPDESKVLTNAFFYKIEGPDGASGHLLGTMHMGIDAEKELPPVVWKALSEASVFTIEADITDASLSTGMMLPKDQNLRELLGAESWKLLEDRLGVTMAKMMMPMKPAAAAATLAMQGLPITMPMELTMIMKAKEKTIEIDYLESATFQLELLNKVMDVDFLKHMLSTPEAQDSKELLTIYRAGDEEALNTGMLNPEDWGKNAEANIESMIFQRNDDWIPKIEKLLARKNAFVGVGAAHLVGPRGVLASLKKKGYAIERVTK